MFPFLLFISLAALIMGALNSRRVFFIPALAPAMLNVSIIVTVISLASKMEQPIIAVAIGVALGGFVQFAFQIPSFLKNGYSLNPEYDFRHPGLKKMSILMLPATMGMAVAQINIFISTILASYLAAGSITYLYYSMRLIQFPIGIFGVAMGMAVLPALSEHALKGDYDKLRDDFSFALRLLFFITIPAMAGLIALREPIVNILFQRGKFDYAATAGTADALLFYSIGIWAIVGVRIVTASFYSMQDTKTPIKILVVTVMTNIILSLILMRPLKHSGLALANALASTVNFLLLFYFLRKNWKGWEQEGSLNLFKDISCLDCHGCSRLVFTSRRTLERKRQEHGKGRLPVGCYNAVLCSLFFISYLLKSEEMEYIVGLVRRKIR